MSRDITANQNHALQYIARYETPDYGVIVRDVTGQALIRKDFATLAKRRSFARGSGCCVRLTEKGRKWIRD